jgi:hypothetical protein
MQSKFKSSIRAQWLSFLIVAIGFSCCSRPPQISFPDPPANRVTGTELYKQIGSLKWNDREPLIAAQIFSGNVPAFLKQFLPVKVEARDSTGKMISAVLYVSPDYLSVGSDNDWARVPLTPMTAQRIADSLHCFLPTRKIVNDIYAASKVKLEPVPLYAHRDSALIFWHHHLIIEGQRKNRQGLIAGIKKDVVISGKITRDVKSNRVAIYGWHKLDGKPIQPLYTGHVDWYVDYSHGIRLIYRKIKVGRKWMDYTDVMKDPVLRKLLCDEEDCDVFRY